MVAIRGPQYPYRALVPPADEVRAAVDALATCVLVATSNASSPTAALCVIRLHATIDGPSCRGMVARRVPSRGAEGRVLNQSTPGHTGLVTRWHKV